VGDIPLNHAFFPLAERRRSRTYQPWGYHGLPVLKTGWATGPVPLQVGQPSDSRLALAGLHQAALVRQHDRLHPVAEPQLREHPVGRLVAWIPSFPTARRDEMNLRNMLTGHAPLAAAIAAAGHAVEGAIVLQATRARQLGRLRLHLRDDLIRRVAGGDDRHDRGARGRPRPGRPHGRDHRRRRDGIDVRELDRQHRRRRERARPGVLPRAANSWATTAAG